MSPLAYSETLSKATGYKVHLKLENLQMTGSFKERGALNKILSLCEEERNTGVIAASAGNHAQGVAYHASRRGIKATIVMPEATPLVKVMNTKRFGAEVVLHGASYDEAYQRACELQREHGYVLIHAFDDERIIAGQGTIGLEIMEQQPKIEAVVVPVGGGGLISGIAVAMKETNPKVKIIGVEAQSWPAMKVSLEQGQVTHASGAPTLADGIAVKGVGEITFPIVQKYVDQMVTVSEEEIANAILILIEREKAVVEGAGAATLAALINEKFWVKERNIALVLSGGNIDVNMISRIIERGLVKEGRLVRMQVTISDRPGVLHDVSGIIGRMRANIMETHHERAFSNSPIGMANVVLTLETRGPDHIQEIIQALSKGGYPVKELT
jgi:threonine dehydratase